MLATLGHLRTLAVKVAILAFLPGMVFLFNSTFDPDAKPINNKKEIAIADALLSGNRVAFSGYDWYDYVNPGGIKAQYAYQVRQRSDVLILGSSHVADLSGNLLPKKSVTNGAFAGSTLEDIYAVYGIYRKRGLLPSQLIIGIDPWVLNRKFQGNPRIAKALRDDIQYINQLIESNPTPSADSFFDLLGIYSFRRSLTAITTKPETSQQVFSSGADYYRVLLASEISSGPGLNPDGSNLSGGTVVSDTDLVALRQLVIENIAERRNCCFGNFYELAPELKQNLEGFLKLVVRDGVKPVLYLPPEHPLFYEAFSTAAENPMQVQTENYVRSLGTKYNIPIVGSYNPKRCGLEERDFWDGDHLVQSGFAAIFLRNSCGEINLLGP